MTRVMSSNGSSMRALCVLALLGAAGCRGASPAEDLVPADFEGPRAPVALDGYLVDQATYCRTVAQPNLAHWDRDVLTSCGDGSAGCIVSELFGATTRVVDLADARLALRASGERMVVLKNGGALVLRTASGSESSIATWAADPSVSADGLRVAFITLQEGVTEPGAATRVVLFDLRDESLRVIADDSDASSPLVVPDSDDVVYVSSRSGLPSIWRGNGEYEIQVTNLEVAAGDQGVLPTFGNHAVWVPGARSLAFEVTDGGSMIWNYDVAAGTVELLGPGAWPQIAPDGTVLAASSLSSDAACAVTYLSNDEP